MTQSFPSQIRRGAIAATLAAASMVAGFATAAPAKVPVHTGGPHDFDFLVGDWDVAHHRLKGRLVGSTAWEDFKGTTTMWLTLGGEGTVDDNLLELPAGTYRAMGTRAYNRETRQWSIWWFDARYPNVEPPVCGGFKDGLGTFIGTDVHDGKPILVRFQWSKITPDSAQWDQAFSPDDGATWETNWVMQFTRAKR